MTTSRLDDEGTPLASLADPETLLLERPLPLAKLVVPAEVRLEGERLVYPWLWGRRKAKEVEPGHGLLTGFIELDKAPGSRIAAYARRWGVLGVCAAHDWPFLHDGICLPRRVRELPFEKWAQWECWEPLGAWRKLAQEAASLMRVADSLHRNQMPSDEDSQVLAFWTRHRDRGRTIEARSRALAGTLNMWLARGDARPGLLWEAAGPRLVLGALSLQGFIALEMMAVIAGAKGFSFCAACSRLVSATNYSSPRRQFCEKCRKANQSKNRAAVDFRRRQRAIKLIDQGYSLEEVAARVGQSEETIAGWQARYRPRGKLPTRRRQRSSGSTTRTGPRRLKGKQKD